MRQMARQPQTVNIGRTIFGQPGESLFGVEQLDAPPKAIACNVTLNETTS
jgi:hypothetical protein